MPDGLPTQAGDEDLASKSCESVLWPTPWIDLGAHGWMG